MSASPNQHRNRCDDLLVQQAIYGLSQAEQKDIDEFNREFEITDDDRFESAVGTLDCVFSGHQFDRLPEEFSDRLRQKIIDDADQHLDTSGTLPQTVAEATPVTVTRATTGWSTREKFLGFITAASLLFALANIAGLFKSPEQAVQVRPTPSIAERLDALKESGLASRSEWTNPTNDSASEKASGEVVWSDSRQEGYMVFKDLEVNDPAVQQYQLWIFDTERDDALPVDGGVFDIAADGELIIPIDSKLAIAQARMFAVTIEIPGGVVQSKRERLPLLATVEL